MRAGMLRYIRRDGGDHFPGVVYGESLVNATVEEMLVRVADEMGVDVGGFGTDRRHAGDNYLRYQIDRDDATSRGQRGCLLEHPLLLPRR